MNNKLLLSASDGIRVERSFISFTAFLACFVCIIIAGSIFLLFDTSLAYAEDLQASKIIIYKGKYEMDLLDENQKIIRSYKVSLGKHPKGAKQQQGDGKTPEGNYIISGRNEKSLFHRSLKISYPNAIDGKKVAEQGVDPGGDIMIHGLKNGMGWVGGLHRLFNWTDGCIAVTDNEIEEIWKLVPNGTAIEIKP